MKNKKNIIIGLLLLVSVFFAFYSGQKNMFKTSIAETEIQIINEEKEELLNEDNNEKNISDIEIGVYNEYINEIETYDTIPIHMNINSGDKIKDGITSINFKVKFLSDYLNLIDINIDDSVLNNSLISEIDYANSDLKNGEIAFYTIYDINNPLVLNTGSYLLANMNVKTTGKDGYTNLVIDANYTNIKYINDGNIEDLDISYKDNEYFIQSKDKKEDLILKISSEKIKEMEYIGSKIFFIELDKDTNLSDVFQDINYNSINTDNNIFYVKIKNEEDLFIEYNNKEGKISKYNVKHNEEETNIIIDKDLNKDGVIDIYDNMILFSL